MYGSVSSSVGNSSVWKSSQGQSRHHDLCLLSVENGMSSFRLKVLSGSEPPPGSLLSCHWEWDVEFPSSVSGLKVLSGSKPPSWSLLSFRLWFRINRSQAWSWLCMATYIWRGRWRHGRQVTLWLNCRKVDWVTMKVLDMGGGRLASIHRNYISGHLYMAWTMTTSHIVTQSQ